jgi:Ca2+-binding RTX toxin-like protein
VDGDASGDIYQSIENLEGSEFSDRLFGDNLNNTLIGLGGDDFLDGYGGDDTLIGGTGNDTYNIDSAGEVTESIDEGIDTVNASVDYILTANVENLNLLEGTAAINGTGNELNNIINGNSARNTINGGAGNDTLFGFAGGDILAGGDGNDYFAYNAITDAGDRIIDFTADSDKLVFTDLLKNLGYQGANAIADGVLGLRQAGNFALIQIDPDGTASTQFRPAPFILLDNVSVAALNNSIIL